MSSTPDDLAWFTDIARPVDRRSLRFPNSLAARLRKFFADNPEEELTIRMICEKFDANPKTVEKVLGEMKAAGELESLHVVRLRTKGIAR